jgi:hypothetical protein
VPVVVGIYAAVIEIKRLVEARRIECALPAPKLDFTERYRVDLAGPVKTLDMSHGIANELLALVPVHGHEARHV